MNRRELLKSVCQLGTATIIPAGILGSIALPKVNSIEGQCHYSKVCFYNPKTGEKKVRKLGLRFDLNHSNKHMRPTYAAQAELAIDREIKRIEEHGGVVCIWDARWVEAA